MAGKKLNKLGVENSLWNNIRAKKGSGKKPTKEMLTQEKKIRNFENGGPLNGLTKNPVNPFIQVPFVESTTPEGFAFDWMNSPFYEERLPDMGYKDPKKIIKQRIDSLTNFDLSIGRGKSLANPATEHSKGYVHLNPNDIKEVGYNTIIGHEAGHLFGATPGIGVKDPTMRSSPTGYTPEEESFINKMNINPAKNFHDEKAYEMKADLYSNRFKMFEEGVYDIRKGKPFTIDDLNRAKEKLKGDKSFKRLLDQTGDENYIQMMNTIAMQQQDSGISEPMQMQAAYGGMINPMQDQYFLGGLLGSGLEAGKGSGIAGMAGGMLGGLIPTTKKDGNTSIGGSAASGAVKGAASLAMLGPIGMGAGALVGGLTGFFTGKKQQKDELAQQAEMEKQQQDSTRSDVLANMNYGMMNSSNLPMAMGGDMGDNQVPVGSFNDFPVGGTHEQNPLGGIPQGFSPDGKQRNVEQGEGKFKFKDGDYIFSNRLILE